MNRYRMQFAPGVWKPCLNSRLVSWLRPWRMRHQRRVQQLMGIDVQGAGHVRSALDAGQGVLIMPNHPSHADPFSIYMAADTVGTALYIMATWHVFHDKPWLTQRLLQCHGCFSVDREANDIGAFRQAVELLEKQREPLVIFPEGEIYHCNDRVTPFREGAAAIGVAAARRAKRPIVCIPCAISYRYLEDPTASLLTLMGDLEEAILWRRQPQRDLADRIYRFAEALLAVKEVEYFGQASQGELSQRITEFRERVLSQIESRYGLSAGQLSLPERVKQARRTIMELIDRQRADQGENSIAAMLGAAGESSSPEVMAAQQQGACQDGSSLPREVCQDDLEDLFLVVQSFSYPGDYVRQRPSLERLAETLDKFEEDVLRRPTASIRAPRSVKVQFAEPIEIVADRKNKQLTSQLSRQVEATVQEMLESLRGHSLAGL